ncbi:hypothetical protein L1987_30539 [Smallanthus sonchifolius]|uniref:Uncharacterized protein n=1 Tax=Smallanthus sonchifolius TaxID=185202 RepID=A0ACB9I5R5_9ASTR|nr:hypothetical protein L1987_30539 [Smallanthus sonchifolius]
MKVTFVADEMFWLCAVSMLPTYGQYKPSEKMRQRNDLMRWLMPPAVQVSLASQLQGIRLDSRPSSGELSSQLPQGGGELAAVA